MAESKTSYGENPYKVHVTGLGKVKVLQQEGYECYDQEFALFDFFQGLHGCMVSDIRLMVDAKVAPKPSLSRGFAFIELDDEESFLKALTLDGTACDGTSLKVDEKSGGVIRVAVPHGAKVDTAQMTELSNLRAHTEGINRELQLTEAKNNELMRQVRAQMKRQEEVSSSRSSGIADELQAEKERQLKINSALKEMQELQAGLEKILRIEERRTQGLEQMLSDGSILVANNFAEGSVARAGEAAAVQSVGAIHCNVDPEAWPLVRSRSSGISQDAPVAWAPSADDAQPPAAATLKRECSADQPWAVKRDISRSMLEEKIQALSRTTSKARSPVGSPKAGANKISCAAEEAQNSSSIGGEESSFNPERKQWADLSDDEEDFLPGPLQRQDRKEVRICNLPLLDKKVLEAELRQVLNSCWQAQGLDDEPSIVNIRIIAKEATYANKLAGKGTEAFVTFSDPTDSNMLVQRAQTASWERSANLSMHGRSLKVDWPDPEPAPDWRRATWRAATDASSEVSYRTLGTQKSYGTALNQNATTNTTTGARRPRAADAGGAPSSGHGNTGGNGSPGAHGAATGGQWQWNYDQGPVQNRTVILSGIPADMQAAQVRQELLRLLANLYKRTGYNFEPKAQLHKGNEDEANGDHSYRSAIEVRPDPRGKDENGGTIKLRLRYKGVAIWLVTQAKGLKIGGYRVKASWACPR